MKCQEALFKSQTVSNLDHVRYKLAFIFRHLARLGMDKMIKCSENARLC